MKKIFYLILILTLTTSPIFAGQWRGGVGDDTPLGTTNFNDVDTEIYNEIVNPLDRLLSNYRRGMELAYSSGSTVNVGDGEVVVSNSAGSIRLLVSTTSTTAVTFTDLDTGAEAASTTYYVYATVSAASDTTAIFKISASSTAPTGSTYYKRLGSFYNDSGSDMEQVVNDETQYLSVTEGTAANAATCTLPSGYSVDQCVFGAIGGIVTIPIDESTYGTYETLEMGVATSTRAMTCKTESATGSCYYIAVCHK